MFYLYFSYWNFHNKFADAVMLCVLFNNNVSMFVIWWIYLFSLLEKHNKTLMHRQRENSSLTILKKYYLTNIIRQYNINRFVIEVDLIQEDVDTCSWNDWGSTYWTMPWLPQISLVHLSANTNWIWVIFFYPLHFTIVAHSWAFIFWPITWVLHFPKWSIVHMGYIIKRVNFID